MELPQHGPVFPLSPADLSRWSRFGAKGGIGRAEATVDKLAEDPGELMFLAGDAIIVLLVLQGEEYLVRHSKPLRDRKSVV